jgi:hypothetical protein
MTVQAKLTAPTIDEESCMIIYTKFLPRSAVE